MIGFYPTDGKCWERIYFAKSRYFANLVRTTMQEVIIMAVFQFRLIYDRGIGYTSLSNKQNIRKTLCLHLHSPDLGYARNKPKVWSFNDTPKSLMENNGELPRSLRKKSLNVMSHAMINIGNK